MNPNVIQKVCFLKPPNFYQSSITAVMVICRLLVISLDKTHYQSTQILIITVGLTYLIPLYFRGTLISRFSRFLKNRENLVPQKLSDAKICIRENYVSYWSSMTKPSKYIHKTLLSLFLLVSVDIFLIIIMHIISNLCIRRNYHSQTTYNLVWQLYCTVIFY